MHFANRKTLPFALFDGTVEGDSGGISQARVIELAQGDGDYLAKKESIILIGNPRLGETHIAIGLALAACQQSKNVGFFGAAGLVNELLAAGKELPLSKFMAAILKSDLVVLDEVGLEVSPCLRR